MTTRRFELVEGRSRKFWEIAVKGATHTVRFGRLETAGQATTKSFATKKAAALDAEKLVRAKLAKGYREVSGAQGKAVDARSAKSLKASAKKASATSESVAMAFERIESWLRKHGARAIADNLAPGASEKRLAALEKKLGFLLGADLRAMWSIHDGQRKEGHDFYPFPLGPLWSSKQAADRADVTRCLRWMRDPDGARFNHESKMTKAELASDAWVRFGGIDYDGLVTNTESGRVFTMAKDSPPFELYARSIGEWLTRFADALVAGDYLVEQDEGSDCALVPRDREAEREEAERAERQKAETTRKNALTPEALLVKAIRKEEDDEAREALAKAKQKGPAVYAKAVESLFAKATPAFVASTLRPLLNTLKLSAPQWALVVKGGEALENAAIVAVARRRASEASHHG